MRVLATAGVVLVVVAVLWGGFTLIHKLGRKL